MFLNTKELNGYLRRNNKNDIMPNGWTPLCFFVQSEKNKNGKKDYMCSI